MGDRKKKREYVPRTNAVCISIYQPEGGDIPIDVVQACLDSIQGMVNENRLLVSVATT